MEKLGEQALRLLDVISDFADLRVFIKNAAQSYWPHKEAGVYEQLLNNYGCFRKY